MPRTVVLVPTFDHVETLRPAIQSAVQQTDSDVEIHVIGDGAPPATDSVMDELCNRFGNVFYHQNAKSPRTGEPYRDDLLRRIDAEFALYLSDDDIWTRDHVQLLTAALDDHDLASTLSIYTRPGESDVALSRMQFADPTDRQIELSESRVSLTETGHRIDSYLRLPHGWRSTPSGEYTDHWMWKQWLEQPWVRAVTVDQITTIHFADFMRKTMSITERVREQERWLETVAAADWPNHRTSLLRGALFEAFAHADRGLVHFRRHSARIESELADLTTVNDLRKKSDEKVLELSAELAAAQSEVSSLGADNERLLRQYRRVVGSRSWQFGQASATLTGYRSWKRKHP